MYLSAFTHAQHGNIFAVSELISTLQPALTRMARYYAHRSREEADDLLQEAWAWIGVFEALPALDTRIGNPAQHLLQYARWRLLVAIKRTDRNRLIIDAVELDDALAQLPGDDPLEVVSALAFTRTLSSTQRSVLSCLLAGLTWREAGSLLGCTSANVAYHVRQIRERYQKWSVACDAL